MSDATDNDFFNQRIRDEVKHSILLLNAIDNQNIHESVHQLRKCLKRIRGWLRSVRPARNARVYNRELSSLGKEISALRDSSSAIECLERIRHKYGSVIDQQVFGRLESGLRHHRSKITARANLRLTTVRQRLSELLDLYEPFNVHGFSDLLGGIQNTYRQAKRAFTLVTDQMDAELFHEWRKRTKDLQHQLLLFPDEDGPIYSIRSDLDILTGLLGNDQDLYLIDSAVEDGFLEGTEADVMMAIVQFEHASLQQRALEIGSHLYQPTPTQFIRRLRASIN